MGKEREKTRKEKKPKKVKGSRQLTIHKRESRR